MKTLIVDLTERLELAGLPIPPELQPTYSDWTSLEDLGPKLAGAEALFCTPLIPIDEAFLQAAPVLKVIQLQSAGYDKVDLAATRARGIPVSHAPNANAATVAEHVFMVSMALQRQLFDSHKSIVNDRYQDMKWAIMRHGNFELMNKTMGIVGFGRIGRQVARRAAAFDMQTLYADIQRASPEDEERYQVTYVDLPELLRRADILTVHTWLDASTYHLIGEEELSMVKPSALVLNAARGPVVDPTALAEALKSGRVGGAAVDVFETEPASNADPLVQLAKSGFDRLILTPHVAGITEAAQHRALKHSLENLVRFTRGEPLLDICNGVTS
ncbi:MAG: NAD(P)-dependent oxidoreductase [Chloroflexota bacterium]